jgi:endonuclease YncB( thermonuclease family)
MKDFFEKNKVPLTIIVAAFLIAGSIWLSKRPAPVSPQNVIDRQPAPLQLPKTSEPPQLPKKVEPLQHSATRIDYTEASNHIGEYACVSGKIDHVYTSQKGTIFLNFCPDYKTCPFGTTIFNKDAYKFPNPKQYGGQTVEITGLIRAYQGRSQIILDNLSQIKILSHEPLSIKKEAPVLYRVVKVIDGDTIKVDIGGKIETVRLIGMDTPEIAHPNHPQNDYFGPEAAQYAKQLLENQSVYLIPDPMQSNRDKYDRLLRYVFLEDGTLINAKLIAEGYAYNYIYEPFQFMKQFDYLEKQAKEKQLGLWSAKKPEN